jgi:hypothetical protein
MHLDGCPQGAKCVVLVRDRTAEDGQYRTADELSYGAAVALAGRAHLVVVADEQSPQDLRIQPLAEP